MIDEAGDKEKFSWRGAEVSTIQIGNNSYRIVIVGRCGNLADRIIEADEKGYIGVTVSERGNLFKLADYIVNDMFDLQKACEGTNLPRFKVLGLLESYKKIGICFPEVLYPDTSKTAKPPALFEEPAAPYSKFNQIVHAYKKGRSMERAAFENLADILREQSREISDLKKRIEKLEGSKNS